MDADERRAEILAVAHRLFRSRPYTDVSVREIAEAAGVATGLMHHYFGSKRELYLEVLRSYLRLPLPTTPPPGTEASEGVWEAAVDALMDTIEAHAEVWLASVSVGAAARDPDIEELLEDSRELLAERTLRILGLEPEGDPVLRAVARGYGGLAQEIILEWLKRGRLTRDQARRILVDTMPLLVSRVLPHLSDH